MYAVFSLLLVTFVDVAHSATEKNEVLYSCGEDGILRCPAPSKPSVLYRSVIWYKVNEAPPHQLNGLVKKILTQPNSTVQKYSGSMRNIELLRDSQTLVLSNLTLQDTGRYRCSLLAPLGQQNQEGDVHLRVYEQPKDDAMKSDADDSLYVVLAITLLVVSLLMLYVSYISLRNTLRSHKLSKHAWLKRTKEIKNVIVSLDSKGIVTNILPQEYV